MTASSRRLDGVTLGGWAFLALALANTAVEIWTFGVDGGGYAWMCNLSLFLIAYGLLKKDQDWLLGFLSYSVLQSAWIVDNLWRQAKGEPLFGLTEYMYQPGVGMAKFVLSHYHYFMIPAVVVALHWIRKPAVYRATRSTYWIGWTIAGTGRFLFTPERNINCMYNSCFAGGQYRGFWYVAAWCVGVTLGTQFLTRFVWQPWFERLDQSAPARRRALAGLAVCLTLGLVLTAADVRYRLELPRFFCEDGEFAGGRVTCRYTSEDGPRRMALAYRISNTGEEARRCSAVIVAAEKELVGAAVDLPPGGSYNDVFVLDYPERDSVGRLGARCL